MSRKLSKLALAAAFGLALSFTISCSSDDDGGGGDVSYYDPNSETYRCRSGVVEAKCGDEWINSAKYACVGNYDDYGNMDYYTLTWEQYYEQNGYLRCGSSYYHPDNSDFQRCQSGVPEYKCGDEWINSAKYACAGDYDDYGNMDYYTITWEQWYEQNGYLRCR